MHTLQTKFFYAVVYACLAGMLFGISSIHAAGILVTSNADTVAVDGFCTLREAILNANGDNQSGSADCASGVGADAITFASNYTITLNNQLPVVTSVITITGNGPLNTVLQASDLPSTATYRLFETGAGGDLSLNSLTVQNGRCNGSPCVDGGGIYNAAALTVNNSMITGNTATGRGAGIYNSGSLVITNSTFSGNTLGTAGDGGGIYNSAGTASVTNSTFSNNTANNGGGIYNNTGATLNATNNTLSANTGNLNGGGIYNSGGLNLKNSILANNTGGKDCYTTITVNYGINNLLTGASTNACNLSGAGNLISVVDAKIGMLTDNGGSTQTITLLSGSPAIDAGDSSVCAVSPVNSLDQRGQSRAKGISCDIGSYESDFVSPVNPVVITINRANASPTNTGSINFAVTFSKPVIGVDISDFKLNVVNDLVNNPPGLTGASITGVSGLGSNYTVTVSTGTDSGSLGLYLLDDNSISDTSSNPLGGALLNDGDFTSGQSYTIDRVSPRVASMARVSDRAPTNATAVDYTVTFTSTVTGVDVTDFSVTNNGFIGATVVNVTGSGTTYTVSINTGPNSGILRLDLVDNNSIVDEAGNPLGGWGINSQICWNVTTLDKSLPTVTVVKISANPTNAPSVSFKATFSEPVTGVDGSDFRLTLDPGLTGALITKVAGSGTDYMITASTGSGTGTLRLDLIDNDSITDIAGNKPGGEGIGNGDYTSGESYSIDTTPPSVVSIIRTGSPDPTSMSDVDFIITFSENVTGVDSSDFSASAPDLTGVSIVSVTASGPNSYTVVVHAGVGAGTLRLELVDNESILDGVSNPLGGAGAGNGNFTAGESYIINRNFPAVISITRMDANPIEEGPAHFAITFSSAVSGIDTGDFSLASSGVIGAGVTEVTGSGNLYTATVNPGTGNGSIRLDLVDNDTIQNLEGDILGGIGIGNGNFVGGETYTISPNPYINASEKYRSNGTRDGWVLESRETSNKGGSKNSTNDTFTLGDDFKNRQYISILHFPTATLPDNAVITRAILMIKMQSMAGTDPFITHGGVSVDIKSNSFSSTGIFLGKSLQVSDFESPASMKAVGLIQNNPVSEWYWVMLNSSALQFINLKGDTQIRLAFQLDDNNDLGNDYIKFFSGDAIDQGDRPYLLIEYSIPKY